MLPGTWKGKLSITVVSNRLCSVLWPDCFGDIFWKAAFRNRQLGKWQCSWWQIRNFIGLEDKGGRVWKGTVGRETLVTGWGREGNSGMLLGLVASVTGYIIKGFSKGEPAKFGWCNSVYAVTCHLWSQLRWACSNFYPSTNPARKDPLRGGRLGWASQLA